MREELRALLIEISKTMKNPATTNPGLPLSELFDKVFEYSDLMSALNKILAKGMTQEDGQLWLKYAIKNNNILLIQYLKEEKITFDFKDLESQLLQAIADGETELFKAMIESMEMGSDINRQLKSTMFGNTMTSFALSAGQSDIAKILFDKGADLSIPDWLGTSTLSYAIASNNLACLRLLPTIKKEDLFVENIYGFSPLHCAVRGYYLTNNAEILDALCQQFDLNKEKVLNDFKNYPKQPVAQTLLVKKISQYIDIETSENKTATAEPTGPYAYTQKTCDAVKSGLCHGLSFLFALHAVRSRDDLNNFYNAVALLAAWDGKKESLSTPISAIYFQHSFHTLGDLIKQLCNDAIYFFGQDLSIIDTPPHDRKTQYNIVHSGNRHITPIVNVSMQNMTKEEFIEILKNTLKPNTLLDLTGAAHTISIVCNNDNEIYYFDPNHIYPTKKPIKDIEALATLIYQTMPVNFGFQNSAPHYIGVYHLSDKKIPGIKDEYPSEEEIVNQYIFGTERKNNLYDELTLCVLQDNPVMLECILKSKKLPALSCQQKAELIETALSKKSLRCLNSLIQFGDLNQSQMNEIEKNTSMVNYGQILKTLKEQRHHSPQQAKFFK